MATTSAFETLFDFLTEQLDCKVYVYGSITGQVNEDCVVLSESYKTKLYNFSSSQQYYQISVLSPTYTRVIEIKEQIRSVMKNQINFKETGNSTNPSYDERGYQKCFYGSLEYSCYKKI